MNLQLTNKIAIVTGSSTGMGFSVARSMALSGVKVLMVARRLKKLKLAARKIINEGGDVDYISADVSNINSSKKIVQKCLKKWGTVNILINNTGGPRPVNILKSNEKNWNYAIQNNMMSAVRFTKQVIPIMKKGDWGRIVTITSTIAKEPTPGMILSATTRAGLAAFSKAIAIEFAEYNITSNIISPGGVMTDRFKNLVKIAAKREKKTYSQKVSEIKKNIPAKRIANPDEIANVIVFLASEMGSYINGVDLSVDGAFTKGY